MAATLLEIAKMANVSVATVSRALNDRPGVGERLRRRIRGIADRVGYVPHANARALVTGRVPFLGLVVPDITNPFYPALARGAEEEAAAAGYSLLLLNTNRRPERLRQAYELFASRHVAGLVLSVPLEDAGENPARWPGAPQFVVMAGVPAPADAAIGAVEVDDREGGRQVGRHLAAQGWRRIAFVGGAPQDRSTRDRLAGLCEALATAGAANGAATGAAAVAGREPCAVSTGEWSERSGYEQARALLAGPKRPDALFAANDLLALGAARAAAEAGLGLGRDLGLVGYDDIDAVRWTAVPLSSVAQPVAEVGRAAVRRLVALADGGEPGPGLRLEPRLVVRASSLAPGALHPVPAGLQPLPAGQPVQEAS